MSNIFKPIWIIIFTVIPQFIVTLIFYNAFYLTYPLLNSDHKKTWIIFFSILTIKLILLIINAIILFKKKTKFKPILYLILLFFDCSFLYFILTQIHSLFPGTTGRWIINPDEYMLYLVTFFMPSFIFYISSMVTWLTPEEKKNKILPNIIAVIMAPLLIYLVVNSGYSILFAGFSYKTREYITTVFFIISAIIFFFFLFKLIYLISKKITKTNKIILLVIKILFGIIFPITGLILNEKLLNYGFGGNIFGNFSHIRFYIIAAISGIALCIPDLKNKNYRIILFSVRMICLSYVLYFFMVFLPFLPLSVAAIIILGAGILMLTPLILTFIYIKQLINDFNYLKKLFKSYIVTIIAIYSFLALPIAIIIDYSLDKYTLNQTLNYIYETDYLNSPAINIKRVKNLIGIIKENRTSRSSKLHKPYLSSFYKWYVFDNLTLSDKKINNIEKIIFGKSNFYTTANTSMPESNGVSIEKISHKTTYDYEKKYFTSTIDFYIKNDTNRQKEFLTTFNLPENAFITDYYLYIDNKKEMGLLCEKKSAAWVYQKITEQRRDPGILYYSDKDTIAFRVFPFNSFETRQTGFKIIHKNSIELKITNKVIKLAGDSIPLDNNESSIINKNIHYITIELKKELPTNNNAPEYCFIIDSSKYSKIATKKNYIKYIYTYIEKNKINFDNINIVSGNYKFKRLSLNKWSQELFNQKNEGGFFAEYGVKQVLLNYYIKKKIHPFIIIVSDNYNKAVFTENISNFEITYPESDLFYVLSKKSLDAYKFNKPKKIFQDNVINLHRKKAKLYIINGKLFSYLADNGSDSIAYNNIMNIDSEVKGPNQWINLMKLKGIWIKTKLFPWTNKTLWRKIIFESFKYNIMIPATSFIVVENDSQRQALLSKQNQVLKSTFAMDTGKSVHKMSEPSFLIIFIASLLMILIRYPKFLRIKNRFK